MNFDLIKKHLKNIRPELLITAKAPGWITHALSKNRAFEGPNGNKAVGYEWIWTWGERYDKYEDGLVSCKISDKDNAQECTTCHRAIVHVYWVLDIEKDTILPYGGDHLHIPLGYPREIEKARLEYIKSKIVNKEEIERSKEQDERLKKEDLEYFTTWLIKLKTIDLKEASKKYEAFMDYINKHSINSSGTLPYSFITDGKEFAMVPSTQCKSFIKYNTGWYEEDKLVIQEKFRGDSKLSPDEYQRLKKRISDYIKDHRGVTLEQAEESFKSVPNHKIPGDPSSPSGMLQNKKDENFLQVRTDFYGYSKEVFNDLDWYLLDQPDINRLRQDMGGIKKDDIFKKPFGAILKKKLSSWKLKDVQEGRNDWQKAIKDALVSYFSNDKRVPYNSVKNFVNSLDDSDYASLRKLIFPRAK